MDEKKAINVGEPINSKKVIGTKELVGKEIAIKISEQMMVSSSRIDNFRETNEDIN